MSEPCDWCSRPGKRVSAVSHWKDNIEFEDPILCDVCVFFLMAPIDIQTSWKKQRGYDRAIRRFHRQLEAAWRLRMEGTSRGDKSNRMRRVRGSS
jgi:hypothetical protein